MGIDNWANIGIFVESFKNQIWKKKIEPWEWLFSSQAYSVTVSYKYFFSDTFKYGSKCKYYTLIF